MVATVAAGTSAQYYLSLTDYYTGSGEPRGQWIKVGFDTGFAAGGEIETGDFERLHAGLDRNGKFLVSNRGGKPERVGGYDVTFSAPKSVSVLWGLADDALRQKIEQAHARAVKSAIDVLENHAAFCRSGKNGVHREKVRLTAAAFQHGDARPAEHADGEVFADPNLHTHVVVMNLGEKIAATRATNKAVQRNRIGALDGKAIFAWKMALGAGYHLEFSSELQKLGFEVAGIGKNGMFEIDGVDSELARYFSARRKTIEEELEKAGLSSGQAPALAAQITRATRKSKRELGVANRFKRWRERAKSQGFDGPEVQRACLASSCIQTSEARSEAELDAAIASRIRRVPRDLTENESYFERRQLHAAVATALVGTGVSVARVEQEIDKLLAANAIVALDQDVWGHEIYSTPELLAIERDIGAVARRLNRKRGVAPEPAMVEKLIAKTRLSDEQKEAVRAATRGDAITILEGAPGSGKTTTLGPVKEAWEAAGFRVIGSAAAWKIAHMLRDDLQIDARATDAWLAGAEHGLPFLDKKTVLILDEAGLLSSRLSVFRRNGTN